MKSVYLIALLLTLPSAFASDPTTTKVYSCDDGVTLKEQFEGGNEDPIIISVRLEDSSQDGPYAPLGDGFGFYLEGNEDITLMLDANLYRGNDEGQLSFGTQNVTCRRSR